MIHTGPIHLKAHAEDDCDCEDGDCAFTDAKDFPGLQAAMDEGFWWECSNCGRRTGYDDEDDDELPELDPVCTVFKGGNVVCHAYCNVACHDEHMDARDAAEKMATEAGFRLGGVGNG